MLCEKYKDALIETAVNGGELAPALRAHVKACRNCAAELDQQRTLMAAIDTNVSRQMNAPVPVAILQRFEASLAQQPQLERSPQFRLIFTGAFAMLAAAAIVVALLAHAKIQTTGPSAKGVAVRPIRNSDANKMQHDGALAAQVTVAPGHRPRTLNRAGKHAARVMNAPTPRAPEVIVPPDERIALAHFIAQSRTQEQLVAALVTPPPRNIDQPMKHIEIPDIRTADLAIAPIGEETRR